jgi:hypothetical protein
MNLSLRLINNGHLIIAALVLSNHIVYGDSWGMAKDILTVTSHVSLADPDRMEKNRRAFCILAARSSRTNDVTEVLDSGQHYNTANSYVDTIVSGWPTCSYRTLSQWTDHGIDKVPLAIGYQPDEAKLALNKIIQVGKFTDLDRKINELQLSPGTKPMDLNLKRFLERFDGTIRDWMISLIDNRSGWSELSASSKDEEIKNWKKSRVLDEFSTHLLLSEALRRANEGRAYPKHWISYAAGAMHVGYFTSAPLQNGVLLYQIALKEKNQEGAEMALAFVQKFAPLTSAVSFRSYEELLELATSCGLNGQGHDKIVAILDQKLLQAEKGLNPYEKMIVYPELAAGFIALGRPDKALPLREESLAFIEKDIDPETKGVGLTRLWLSYAVAGDEPDRKVLARMNSQAQKVGLDITDKEVSPVKTK